MLQRYIVELGTGADLHGADMTKAARRAVKDAISRSCLCGLVEVLGRSSFQGVHVHAEIAVPDPAGVDVEAVKAVMPMAVTPHWKKSCLTLSTARASARRDSAAS